MPIAGSILHTLLLIVLLISLTLPLVQVAHARHARTLAVATMFFAVVSFLLCLRFGSHISDRSDLVMLRCYAFSSVLSSLADELFSLRDEQTSPRFVLLAVLGLLFFLTLSALIAGISGSF